MTAAPSTPAEDVVEAVARAICESAEADVFDELSLGGVVRALYLQQARAAIEANLRAQLASSAPVQSAGVVEALEPFADMAGEGSEDFPDDTVVHVKFGRTDDWTLTLGDFRRVQAVFAALAPSPASGQAQPEGEREAKDEGLWRFWSRKANELAKKNKALTEALQAARQASSVIPVGWQEYRPCIITYDEGRYAELVLRDCASVVGEERVCRVVTDMFTDEEIGFQ